MQQWRYSLSEIEQVARQVYEQCKGFGTWALQAQMGAGKTTFVHALCDVLGVEDAVSSPTFSIINEYSSNSGSIYHMDWYRLRDEQEAVEAGVEEYLYGDGLCLVEWPEKARGLLPENTVYIYIEIVDDATRILKIVLPHLQETN